MFLQKVNKFKLFYFQDKIVQEIQEVMGNTDRDVTLSDINALTYLGQAIMESMRIHGTFPVILRRATKDTKLCKCRLHRINWYQLTVFICVTQAINIVYSELSFFVFSSNSYRRHRCYLPV